MHKLQFVSCCKVGSDSFSFIKAFFLVPVVSKDIFTLSIFCSQVLLVVKKMKISYLSRSLVKVILYATDVNPLSPSIHIQILQTDLHTFP